MEANILKEFYFTPAQDKITVVAPDYVVVKFGIATSTLEDNTKESHWVNDCFQEIKALLPGVPLKVLVDFSTIDSSEYNSDESNSLYRDMLRDERITAVAVFGLHSGWMLLINLIAMFAPHKLKTFATETEARAWLDTGNVAN
jgi:hypothetical protein